MRASGSGPGLAIVALVIGAALVAGPARAAAGEPVPWLGITYGQGNQPGVLIKEVHPSSAAAAAGLRRDDIIVAVDGQLVFNDLGPLIGRFRVGDRAPLLVDRGGRRYRITPRLRARPSGDELVHQRLVGYDLPELALEEPSGARVLPSAWRGRVLVLALFDATCDPCATGVAVLAARLAAAGLPDDAVEAWVLAQTGELAALLARVPLPVLARSLVREDVASLLGGLAADREGAIVVIDPAGVIRYGAAASSGAVAFDEAARVAIRLRAEGPGRHRGPASDIDAAWPPSSPSPVTALPSIRPPSSPTMWP